MMHRLKKVLCATVDDILKDAEDNDNIANSESVDDIHHIMEIWEIAHKLYHANISNAA